MAANRLKVLRAQKGMSQQELAKSAGVSKTTVVSIERGTSRPRASTLNLLAKALNVPIRALGPSRSRTDPDALGSALTSGGSLPSSVNQPAADRSNEIADVNATHHAAPGDAESWPWLGYRQDFQTVLTTEPDERQTVFHVLARGCLSFEELEALLFVALVLQFRRAAGLHEYQPEQYRARVDAFKRVLADAECVGRNLWFAFDFAGGVPLDMDNDEPDSTDLKQLRRAFERWKNTGGYEFNLQSWIDDDWWWAVDPDGRHLTYQDVEASILAWVGGDVAHHQARQRWASER